MLDDGSFPPIPAIRLGALPCYRTAMMGFTELELAALRSMFGEVPDLAPTLERQLSNATVANRENSGVGFFTTISVPPTAKAVERSEPLSGETHARLPNLAHGLGFVLFFNEGHITTLEGFTYGSESTCALDLTSLAFDIVRVPVNRVG